MPKIIEIVKQKDFIDWVVWYDSRHNVEYFCDVYTTDDKEFSELSELKQIAIKGFANKLYELRKELENE